MFKKILSIDGGGIKGVFPASFLASIEETLGDDIADFFDLIVGTSTGGIIALGLGLGFSGKEILNFYEQYGPSIFQGNRILRFIRHLGFSKYGSGPLKQALTDTFGDRKLGDSKKRLVVPSFNLDTGEVYIYKTAHHQRFQSDYKKSVVNVALATSAAPTFFPVHITSSGIPLVDGGLWANNPMGLAAVEAISILDWSRDSIKMLSVGCTTEALNVRGGGGRLSWAPNIADVILYSQSSASLGTAQLLIGHENVIRISPLVPRRRFGIDVVSRIDSLKGLGESEARKAYPQLSDFFSIKAEPFKPIYRLSQ
jgi:hypothetical protein